MSILMPSFDLNVTPGGMPPVLHMAQYDSGRTYVANLKESGGPYSVVIGTTAKIRGRNAAGVCWEQDCTIDSTHLDQVQFTPEGAATDQFGIMPVQLELTDTNQEVISTLIIIFDIQRAGYTNEEAASSPEFETAMEAAAAEAIGSTAVLKRDQAEKTSAMTQPVGIAEDGTLWVQPGGGGGTVTPASIVTATGDMTATQKTDTRTNLGAGTYSKPSGGIPLTDLAQNVQTAIGLGQKAVVTYIAQTSSVDVAPSYIQSALLAGYKIVLQEVNMGDYEIPLSFVNSTGTAAVFSAIIRDYSTGDAKAVIYYVDDQRQTTKTVTAIGGGSADAVTYIAQTGKTDSEKAQARTNIGASAEPSVVTVTGNTPSITPANNTIYDCTGDGITSVTVSSYSYGVAFTMMFNVQPNTTPTITIDSKIAFPVGFAFEANRSYEINVDGKGHAVVGSWELVS